MAITVTTRIEEDLGKLIDTIAKEEGVDRSAVIRRALSKATREWLIEKCLEDYEAGRITLWQGARKCDLSLWEMIDEVKRRKIHVPYTTEELREDLKALQ